MLQPLISIVLMFFCCHFYCFDVLLLFMLLQPVISIVFDDIYLHCQPEYIVFDNIYLHFQCNRLFAICYWLIAVGH